MVAILRLSLAAVTVILAARTTAAQSQPKTPYPGMPPLSEVTRIRDMSDHTRKLRNFQPNVNTPAQTIFSVGIGYCNNERVIDQGYLLRLDSSGATVRMGDVQSFTITHLTATTIFLRVTVLPSISEKDLLTERPSYSDLKEKYSHVFEVALPRSQGTVRPCIVGKDLEYDDDRQQIAFLDAVDPNRTMQLSYDGNKVWWAIPSVISDPAYPLRVGSSAYETGVITLKDK
jgi:hypothetical protein